jgi:hypothetical protein
MINIAKTSYRKLEKWNVAAGFMMWSGARKNT